MSSDSPSAAGPTSSSYSTDPALYIYTSLTSGSSHIVTATSRLETILRANRVPFKALDVATDDKARMLWSRRAAKDASGRLRKLPGLVQMGMVLGDLVEIEEWNEYGELKQHVTIYYDEFTQPSISQAPKLPPPLKKGPPVGATATAMTTSVTKTETKEDVKPVVVPAKVAEDVAVASAARSVAEEAAQKAKQVRLQALRDKVHGKGGETKGGEKKEGEAEGSVQADVTRTEDTKEEDKETGLQSPTTGVWRAGNDLSALRATSQSPTSTSWRPIDVDGPITVLHGSVVRNASADEIAAVEKAQMITEEDEETADITDDKK